MLLATTSASCCRHAQAAEHQHPSGIAMHSDAHSAGRAAVALVLLPHKACLLQTNVVPGSLDLLSYKERVVICL